MKILIFVLFFGANDCPIEKEIYRNFTGIKRVDKFLYREQKRFWKQKQREEKKEVKNEKESYFIRNVTDVLFNVKR